MIRSDGPNRRSLSWIILAGVVVIAGVGWSLRRPTAEKKDVRQEDLRATRGPEKAAGGLGDPRLSQMVRGTPNGLTAGKFEAYLEKEGWRPGAVLACALLAGQDAGLLKKIRVAEADASVLAVLPLLDKTGEIHLDNGEVLARLRALGVEGSLTESIGLRVALGTKDPAGMREALARMVEHGVPDTAGFTAVAGEMRAALAAVGIQGTEAEIVIDGTAMNANSYRSRSAGYVSEVWRTLQKDPALPEAERMALADDCLNALEDLRGRTRSSQSLRGQIDILKTLPPGARVDEMVPAERMTALEEEIRKETARDTALNEAFLRASPAVIDGFYTRLRAGYEVEADDFLLLGK